MFLNYLFLDLTVIDLMSIVHMDKIWAEIAKKSEMRTSGGGGGVVSDFGHPRTRGGGGSKEGKFLRTSFMDGPLCNMYTLTNYSFNLLLVAFSDK